METQYILKTKDDGSVVCVHDVQKVLLEMLVDIDDICQRHNIPYYLTGGSCLGAVRHKGFIPWDDDADIGMLKEDYDRFLAVLQQEWPTDKYYMQCLDTHREYNVLIPIMKLRKKGTYVKETNTLLSNKCKDGDGVFIDVFLIDYISEKKWIDVSCRMVSYVWMAWILLFENIGLNPYRAKKAFVKFSRYYSYKNRHSSLIGYDLNWVFNSPFRPVVYRKDDIYPVQYHAFEDTHLCVPNNCKALLDVEISVHHMSYPPLHQRAPKHIVDINLEGDKPCPTNRKDRKK